MEKSKAYSCLAEWFEYLNDDCDYEKWSQYLIMQLKKFSVFKGLDIGCGSGYFTRFLYANGYDMTGLDISTEMLDVARKKSMEERKNITYLQGDVSKFSSFEKYDFVTAINDCFNYVPKTKLVNAFKNVYKLLNKNGVFIFDISSEKKFNDKLSGTVSVDDREEVTYLSFNSRNNDEINLDVTLFVKSKDGKYERFDEKHTQYVYSVNEIRENLENVGFTVLECNGIYGEDVNKTDRIYFIASKK